MTFDDTPEEAAFRSEVRAWLDANATRKAGGFASRGRTVGISSTAMLAEAKAWQNKKAQAGYVQITWPREYGCRAGRAIEQVIFDSEEAAYDVPLGFFKITIGMCLPTLLAYATPEQKQRYIPRGLAGEEVWCQMFSEPAAGSDLAALRMRAVRDGDQWVLNGQKIWTSGAHFADYGIVLTRSNPDAPKHRGLTMFFVDMRTPGIEHRPIRQIEGSSTFNEVFFKDVRIPDSQRLGEVDDGWKVALTTLMNERVATGGPTNYPEFDELYALCATLTIDGRPALEHDDVRSRLADWYVSEQGLRFTRYRIITAISRGEQPGPESSIGKLVSARRQQDIAAFALELMGPQGLIADEELAPMGGAFQKSFFWTCGQRIAGGTDEILRNIIAERVLGLPPEPRLDKPAPAPGAA
jgi:alkylation response protein AidB-like acyl-CoA dehydrogenase